MSQPPYAITRGATLDLPDVEGFIALLNATNEGVFPGVSPLFDAHENIFIARAPGRLDVMGGIADYSGSLVLEMPTREATLVAAQRERLGGEGRRLRIISITGAPARRVEFEMPLADFESSGEPVSYEYARAYFQRDSSQHWPAYVAGVFLVLMRERGLRFNEGMRLLISSSVPEGKGVSSSAALEVAAMSAVVASYGIEIEPREIALLCQLVENAIVGAPCGVMDQTVSACGEQGKLLALVCQPAELQGSISLPPDLAVWGLDSGVRHSVGGGDYGSVRAGAFMGYRILAAAAGLKFESPDANGRMTVEDPRWGGYLSNITPSEFESSLSEQLPEWITGDEFLARFGGTTDGVTRVDPRRVYAVRRPTAHAVYEHFRVRAFAELLHAGASERRNELLGELMYQSHASYSSCGLGSEATDLLVRLVREAGTGAGLYGAKITGGGSGGTVAVLGRPDGITSIKQVVEKFRQRTSHEPFIFEGSSPGSAVFGCLMLESTASNR